LFSLAPGFDTIDRFVAMMATDVSASDVYGPGATVLTTTSTPDAGSFVVRYESEGSVYHFVVEVRSVAGGAGIVVIEYGTWQSATIADGLASAQQHILIDGQPVLTTLPIADIAAAIGQ
jgi:hypothetical protein